MHELGIICEVIKIINNLAVEEKFDRVEAVVLEVGELSGISPMLIHECFPIASRDNALYVDTKITVETVIGSAKCDHCEKIFNVIENEGYCPICKCFDKQILCGTEFIIKEVIVP